MPNLKFLANMNMSPLTVDDLRQKGWGIIRVSEAMDEKAKDLDILHYARTHNRVLITQDLDFSTSAISTYFHPEMDLSQPKRKG